MALPFLGIGKSKNDTQQASEPQPVNTVPKGKPKKDGLNTVFDESVIESVFEDLKSNKEYIMADDGDTKYVAVLFDVNEIGGLSGKVAKKDESKGSIIEAVRTGRIKTYIKAEMLEDDCFIIIPDRDTLNTMDEFRMLVGANYILCVIDPVTQGIETITDESENEVKITFQQLMAVTNGTANVDSLFPGHNTGPQVFSGTDVDYGDNDEEILDYEDDLEDLPDDVDEDVEDFEEINEHINSSPVTQSAPAATAALDPNSWVCPNCGMSNSNVFCANCGTKNPAMVAAQPVPQPVPQQVQQVQQPVYEQPMQQPVQQSAPISQTAPVQQQTYTQPAQQFVQQPVYEQPVQETSFQDKYAEEAYEDIGNGMVSDIDDVDGYDSDDMYEDDYDDVTSNEVDDFVVRKFYSDDLGLEISTEPFDIQFLHGNPFIPFDEHRGPGWLNEQISNIARDGNTRMQRMHTENLYTLRTRYMKILQGHCANIAKSLDTTTDNTQYGQFKAAIEQNRQDEMERIDENIAARVDRLERAWEDTLERVGEAAKADAIKEHIERYGDEHNRDIAKIRIYEKEEIERDYQNSLTRLNADRRTEATKLLDIAINTTLKELSEVYIKILESEKREYVRIQNEITRFIDENRKHEIVRIDTLSEENKHKNAAEIVRKEYTSKIRAMAAEFDTKTASLQADVNKMRIEHENAIASYKSDFEAKIREEKDNTAAVQRQLDELLAKYADLESRKNAEYAEQMNRLRNENMAYRDELDHVIDEHKRTNRLSTYLVVAAVIAFLGIGFMIGSIVNMNSASKKADENKTVVVIEDKTQQDDEADTNGISDNTAYENDDIDVEEVVNP